MRGIYESHTMDETGGREGADKAILSLRGRSNVQAYSKKTRNEAFVNASRGRKRDK
jgi:hypothetical protein